MADIHHRVAVGLRKARVAPFPAIRVVAGSLHEGYVFATRHRVFAQPERPGDRHPVVGAGVVVVGLLSVAFLLGDAHREAAGEISSISGMGNGKVS